VGTIEELPTVAELIGRIVDQATAVLDGFGKAGAAG